MKLLIRLRKILILLSEEYREIYKKIKKNLFLKQLQRKPLKKF